MNRKDLEEYLLGFEGVWRDYPFDEKIAVYKVGHEDAGEEEQMFALIRDDATPLRVSLKCDPILAKHLREKYDEVQPGDNLNKKIWNTIVCTGQLDAEEIKDLARLSYQLATE